MQAPLTARDSPPHVAQRIPLFTSVRDPLHTARDPPTFTPLPPLNLGACTTLSPQTHTTPQISSICLQDKEVSPALRGSHIAKKDDGLLTLRAQPVPTPSTTRSPRRRRKSSTRTISRTRRSSLLVRCHHEAQRTRLTRTTDKKARDELAGKVGKGKGPLNTGSQGIKKSGKK